MAENNQDYNRGGFITFIFTMIFVLTFLVYLVTIHPGVDLGEKIKEVPVSGGEAPKKVIDISTIKQPWIESSDVAEFGANVYKANCTVCHGDKGLGDGAAGAALIPKPRNLIEGQWKQGGDSISLFNTLKTGIPGSSMASFSHLKLADRWALVQFIRSITKNKLPDDAAKLNEFAATAN